MQSAIARRMWHLLEPYHAVVYFSPEVAAAMRVAGLKGYWMGYFAGRAAPLGQVPPELVTALFYNFAPRMVARALPDAWTFADRERVIAARLDAVGATLRALVPDPPSPESIELALQAALACLPSGRPMFAAWSSLPWPTDPHLALWHAATLLREHRGDGHVAALGVEGFDGCEAHVWVAASGAVPREWLQPYRGWTDEEWEAAADRLRTRGWLNESGRVTTEGSEARAKVERLTDRMALAPWIALGEKHTARLAELLEPIVKRIVESGIIPYPNPMGVPTPGLKLATS